MQRKCRGFLLGVTLHAKFMYRGNVAARFVEESEYGAAK